MITIISGTHRNENLTYKFTELYSQLLKLKNEENQIWDLRTLPNSFFQDNSIFGKPHPAVDNLFKTYLQQTDKIVFVMPEYNGSFPGIVKLLIDSVEPAWWKNKKIGMIGVASGRSGNLRGMDHLTSVMHYLDAHVLPYKLPISRIHTLMSPEGEITDAETIRVMQLHADKFVAFANQSN